MWHYSSRILLECVKLPGFLSSLDFFNSILNWFEQNDNLVWPDVGQNSSFAFEFNGFCQRLSQLRTVYDEVRLIVHEDIRI